MLPFNKEENKLQIKKIIYWDWKELQILFVIFTVAHCVKSLVIYKTS